MNKMDICVVICFAIKLNFYLNMTTTHSFKFYPNELPSALTVISAIQSKNLICINQRFCRHRNEKESQISRLLLLALIICGDIQPNPGPEEKVISCIKSYYDDMSFICKEVYFKEFVCSITKYSKTPFGLNLRMVHDKLIVDGFKIKNSVGQRAGIRVGHVISEVCYPNPILATKSPD